MFPHQNSAMLRIGATTSRNDHAVDTVLVVDDTPDKREVLEALLHQSGYRVLSADDGRQGLAAVRAARPDLIISDVAMPVMDGIEMCRNVRADEQLSLTPILLVSALRKDSESVAEGLLAGADDYVEAPYDPMRLVAKVARLIERKRAEEALREEAANSQRSAAQLEAVFQAVADGIIVSDMEGNFILVNEAEARINGYDSPEEMKRNLRYFAEVYELGYPDGRQLPFEDWPLSKVLRGESFTDWELTGRRKDIGREWFFSFTGEPVRDARGRPVLAIIVTRDLTERRQAEAALRESEEQLRQAQKLESVGQLAGGVAHDFNNLLTAIIGYSDLSLLRLPRKDQLHRNITEVKRAAERAASLTRQLLAFGRKQVLRPQVIDLNDVVAETDELLRRLIGEDIDFVTVRAPGLWRVSADPNQLSQVIVNLAVNARDAMPRGGRLTIETGNVELDDTYTRHHISVHPGPYVMLAVSDTGHGMNAETQRRIFEPFFTTKDVGKGTGLGLSMVYGVVKQSGGNIWVYSEPGRGTTFKVYLPRVEEEATEVSADAGPPRSARGTETVLIVEDEEMVRGLLRDILEAEGYTVLAAAAGDEALRISEQYPGPLGLVMTDVVMPGMSGRQLSERLNEKRPGIKVLYMSGYADRAIVHHGVLDAGVDFIQKPFTPEAVARKVREILDA